MCMEDLGGRSSSDVSPLQYDPERMKLLTKKELRPTRLPSILLPQISYYLSSIVSLLSLSAQSGYVLTFSLLLLFHSTIYNASTLVPLSTRYIISLRSRPIYMLTVGTFLSPCYKSDFQHSNLSPTPFCCLTFVPLIISQANLLIHPSSTLNHYFTSAFVVLLISRQISVPHKSPWNPSQALP